MVNLVIISRERGIKFNKDRGSLNVRKEVSFFGHWWTRNGIKLLDSKISAIQKVIPSDIRKYLQSFVALVNYLTKYSRGDWLASQRHCLSSPRRT